MSKIWKNNFDPKKKKQYGSGGNSNTNPGGYTGGSGGYDRSFSSRFGNCYQLKLFTFLINFEYSLIIADSGSTSRTQYRKKHVNTYRSDNGRGSSPYRYR